KSSLRGQNEQITKLRPSNVWCDGGGMWIRPGIGSEVGDRERPRVDVAVPADDVEGVVVEHVALVAVPDPDLDQELSAVAVRLQLGRRVDVAVVVGRVLEQLPVLVPVAPRDLDQARRLEHEVALLAL